MFRPILGISVAGLLLSACGPTCQSSCRRMYAEAECDGAAGQAFPAEDFIEGCIEQCDQALGVPGTVRSDTRFFDPDNVSPANQDFCLQNEAEAATWMDCVWSFSDEECDAMLQQPRCAWVFANQCDASDLG